MDFGLKIILMLFFFATFTISSLVLSELITNEEDVIKTDCYDAHFNKMIGVECEELELDTKDLLNVTFISLIIATFVSVIVYFCWR